MPLAFGLLLLALAIIKATLKLRWKGVRGSKLVGVLVKDQVLYFTL